MKIYVANWVSEWSDETGYRGLKDLAYPQATNVSLTAKTAASDALLDYITMYNEMLDEVGDDEMPKASLTTVRIKPAPNNKDGLFPLEFEIVHEGESAGILMVVQRDL